MPVSSEHRGAGEAAQAAQAAQRRADLRAPGVPTPIEERAATQGHVLLGEQHPKSARAEPVRRGESGGACAHHEDIRVVVQRLGGTGVIGHDRLESAQARGAPDEGLVDPLPGPARRHERLVVKARGQETREDIGDRAEVERE